MNKVLVAFFALIVAGCASPVSAGNNLVAYNADKTEAIILHDTPCVSDKARVMVKPEYRKDFNKAATYSGFGEADIVGCYWIYTEGTTVIVITIWEDGDTIPLNPTQFEPLRGALQLKAKGTSI